MKTNKLLYIFIPVLCLYLGTKNVAANELLPKKELPRIVISEFSSDLNNKELKNISYLITDLLLVKIGDAPEVEIIDRSAIEKMIQEITQNMAGLSGSEIKILAGQFLGSNLTVSGHVSLSKNIPMASLSILDSRTAIIKDKKKFPVDQKKFEAAIESMGRFVRENAKKYTSKSENKRYISIGQFNNLGKRADDSFGTQLREVLFDKYLNHHEIGIVSRKHLELLIEEVDLKKYKLVDNTNNSVVRDAKIAAVHIDGDYEFTSTKKRIVINLTLPGYNRFLLSADSSSMETLITKFTEMIDGALEVKKVPVVPEYISKSEKHFRDGMKLLNMAYSDEKANIPLSRRLRKKNTPRISPSEDANKIWDAKTELEEAIALNPYFYKAMVPLAICYLSKQVDEEGKANQLLQRVLIGSNDLELKSIAKRPLADGHITKQAFSLITNDVNSIYNELIDNKYIRTSGYVMALPDNFSELKCSKRFKSLLPQIYMVLSQAVFQNATEGDGAFRREAIVHFNKGKALSNIEYDNRFPPSLATKNIGEKLSDNDRINNLKNAISEFESALFIQPDYYEAMLFLGFCLKDKRINQSERAGRLLNRVANYSDNEDLRFIAGDAIDIAYDMKWGDVFQAGLHSKEYFINKYEKKLNQLVAEYRTSNKKYIDELIDLYKKSIRVNCEHFSYRCSKKRQKTSQRYLAKYIGPFVDLTRQSIGNDKIFKARCEVLNDLWEKYPMIAPHFIASSHLILKEDISELQDALNKIINKTVQPLSIDLFNTQLLEIYSRLLSKSTHGSFANTIWTYLDNNVSSPKFSAKRAYTLFNYGNIDQGIAYLEKTYPATANISYLDNKIDQNDFTKAIGDSSDLLAKLRNLKYLDSENRITKKFKGMTYTFCTDLKQYHSEIIAKISKILQRNIGVLITPKSVSITAGQGEGFYLTPADPLTVWENTLKLINNSPSGFLNSYAYLEISNDEIIQHTFYHNENLMFCSRICSDDLNCRTKFYTLPKGSKKNNKVQSIDISLPALGRISNIISSNNKIWLGTETGLFTIDPINRKFKQYNKDDGFPQNALRSICLFQKKIYIAFEKGFGWINIDNNTFHMANTNISLSHLASSEDGIWMISEAADLYHYSKGELKKVYSQNKETTRIVNLASNASYVAIGQVDILTGDNRIICFDKKTNMKSSLTLSKCKIQTLDFIDQKLWIGGNDIFTILEPGAGKTVFRSTMSNMVVNDFISYKKGTIVAAGHTLEYLPNSFISNTSKEEDRHRSEFQFKEFYEVSEYQPGVYQKIGMMNGKPLYSNQSGNGTLYYLNEPVTYLKIKSKGYWILGTKLENTIDSNYEGAMLCGAPSNCSPDYPGVWIKIRSKQPDPNLTVQMFSPTLKNEFNDLSSYCIDGLPLETFNGTYFSQGADPFGFPFFTKKGGQYILQCRKKGNFLNNSTCQYHWELIEKKDQAISVVYKSAPREFFIRPHNTENWMTSFGEKMPLKISLVADPEANETLHPLDSQEVVNDYWEGGIPRNVTQYVNGVKKSYRSYNKKGELFEKRSFSKDCHLDSRTRYYENGQVKSIQKYHDNIENGEYIEFYKDGQMKTECFYIAGKKDGEFKSYFENGSLWKHAYYNNGKLDGDFSEYHKNGSLVQKLVYSNNKLHKVENASEKIRQNDQKRIPPKGFFRRLNLQKINSGSGFIQMKRLILFIIILIIGAFIIKVLSFQHISFGVGVILMLFFSIIYFYYYDAAIQNIKAVKYQAPSKQPMVVRKKIKRDTQKVNSNKKNTKQKTIKEINKKPVEINIKSTEDNAMPIKKISAVKFFREAEGAHLCNSIALCGNRIAAGMPHKNMIYLFSRLEKDWECYDQINAGQIDSLCNSAHFGESIDLTEKYIIVGAPLANYHSPLSVSELKELPFNALINEEALADSFYKKGYIDRYNRPTKKFMLIDKSIKKFRNSSDSLPSSLREDFNEISNSDLITAWQAFRDGKKRKKAGAAYIFQQTQKGYECATQLLPDFPQKDMMFGCGVAISLDNAIVGTMKPKNSIKRSKIHNHLQVDAVKGGFIYFFQKNDLDWKQSGKVHIGKTCTAVDIDGSWAIAGVGKDIFNTPGGAVFLMKGSDDGWELNKTLRASDYQLSAIESSSKKAKNEYDRDFGKSVAISSQFAFVGNPSDNFGNSEKYARGSVYVYERTQNEWMFHSRIGSGSMGHNYKGFGNTVYVSGQYAIIGAIGAVYIFRYENGSWQQKSLLTLEDCSDQERFGPVAMINDSNVVAGSHRIKGKKNNVGTLYLFNNKL